MTAQSAACVCLLGLRVGILLGAGMSVSSESYVMSGKVLCDGSITCAEESYRVCARVYACVRVVECDQTQQ